MAFWRIIVCPIFGPGKLSKISAWRCKKKIDAIMLPEGYKIDQLTADIPDSNRKNAMKWDGESHITYDLNFARSFPYPKN
jgi:hypothetical protein